jgi:glucose 1-dehydrogenase
MGAAIAAILAADGARVAVLDVDGEGAARTAAEVGGGTIAVECDVADPAAVDRAAAQVADQLGGCQVLVNNAGIVRAGPIESLSIEDWRRVIDVNLGGCFNCTQCFGRLMLAGGGGSIVNISSIGAVTPSVGTGAYGPAKGGIIAFTLQTALEWADRGIRANVILPGTMEKGMGTHVAMQRTAEQQAIIPLGRTGLYSEIATTVAFLAGDRASYVTGESIRVDGGLALAILKEQQRR